MQYQHYVRKIVFSKHSHLLQNHHLHTIGIPHEIHAKYYFLLEKINGLKQNKTSNDHFKTEMTVMKQKMKKLEKTIIDS